ncbi:MAG: viroplasmin family protein [Hyphomicrobiales bacterium]
MAKIKYYVVWEGREVGIFHSWSECQAQIAGYAGAKYKSFKSLDEAKRALQEGPSYESSQNNQSLSEDAKKNIITPSLSVDAACSGNPGKMEYQGVDTATKKRIFYQGVFYPGTNNIGEFLALVHGLAYLKQNKYDYPIYTDSKTALSWVRNKRIKTTLDRIPENENMFQMVDRAIKWLEINTYTTKILKWNTEEWGEIPADFGRK